LKSFSGAAFLAMFLYLVQLSSLVEFRAECTMFIPECYKRTRGSIEEFGHAKCFIFLYAFAKTALKVALAETYLWIPKKMWNILIYTLSITKIEREWKTISACQDFCTIAARADRSVQTDMYSTKYQFHGGEASF